MTDRVSDRVNAVQAEALRRSRREGRQLAPLRWGVVAIVVLMALTSKPGIGLSGRHLGLAIALVVFVIEMAGSPMLRFGGLAVRVAPLPGRGVRGGATVVLQPNGLSELPGSAVVFTAGVALAPALAAVVGGAVTVG